MPITYELQSEPLESDTHVMAKRVDDSQDPPHESFVPWDHKNGHPLDIHCHAGRVWEKDGKPEATPYSKTAESNWNVGFTGLMNLFTEAEKQALYDANAKWQVKHFLAVATSMGAMLSLRDPAIQKQIGGLPVWLPKNIGFTPARARQVLDNQTPSK